MQKTSRIRRKITSRKRRKSTMKIKMKTTKATRQMKSCSFSFSGSSSSS